MQLRNIGSNQTEVELANGNTILYSYSTPVAAHIPGQGYYRTSTRHSVTTSHHINHWIGCPSQAVAQEEINAIADGQ